MDWAKGSDRIVEHGVVNATDGQVRWAPVKSLWLGSMTLVVLIAGPLVFSWSAFAAFLGLTGVTLLAGHSVGMHRRLIHNSFDCPQWLEYSLVYLGVLVGMSGPFGMMRQHDLRDWAQRKPDCHPFLRHGTSTLRDYWWQIHCDLYLDHPPAFQAEARIRNDRIYLWMERHWMKQQVPLGLILFALGGWGFVVWGIAARVAISVTGHWLVGHFAHDRGAMRWRVNGAGVQGGDVPIAALLSMGESWHNNHHAYPGSAKLGLDADQPDPGWWFIVILRKLGLAWNIKTPETMANRDALQRISDNNGGCPACHTIQHLRHGIRPAATDDTRHTRLA